MTCSSSTRCSRPGTRPPRRSTILKRRRRDPDLARLADRGARRGSRTSQQEHPDVQHLRRLDRLAPEREGLHRPRSRRRGRSPLRHEVGADDGLERSSADHLQVLWGALIALGVVVALTPAVGGMARLLGVVDRPEDGRRTTRDRRPAPRRAGALPRHLRARARVPAPRPAQMRGILLGAAVATTVGAVDDFRGLRWWEKLAGQIVAAAHPGRGRGLGAPLHVPARRRPGAPEAGRDRRSPWSGSSP